MDNTIVSYLERIEQDVQQLKRLVIGGEQREANAEEEEQDQGSAGEGQGEGGTGGRQRRGFAAMDPEKRREIASKGGRSSGGGGDRDGNKGQQDEQVKTMVQFRDSHDLTPQAAREVKEAIEKRIAEVEGTSDTH